MGRTETVSNKREAISLHIEPFYKKIQCKRIEFTISMQKEAYKKKMWLQTIDKLPREVDREILNTIKLVTKQNLHA